MSKADPPTSEAVEVARTPSISAPSDEFDGSKKERYGQQDVEATVQPFEPPTDEKPKRWYSSVFEHGSATQIVIAAAIAIGIGMAINATVGDVPRAATVILGIPGRLWLRALTTVVMPLIITAMVLAVQRLKDMTSGGSRMAWITIGYYLITTLIAIAHSILMTALVWGPQMQVMDAASLAVSASDQATIADRQSLRVEDTVQTVFDSFITNNFFNAMANNHLLAVLVCATVVGYLIDGPAHKSSLLRATIEVERIITIIITFLIKLAPYAVFSLILSNIVRLDMSAVGVNLGLLIGATLSGIFIHLIVILPGIFFAVMRENPYTFWAKCAPAWITAWGSASSAATLPVTMRTLLAKKIPVLVCKFTVPLGCLVNMDGTAIYFPVTVTFLAATQGITLGAGDYIIILLLSTLASIGTTPIPSASLVLIVMICGAVNVPITGMYAVIVAIDWFLDRFRTALNVSSDLFAAKIVTKLSRIQDDDVEVGERREEDIIQDAMEAYNRGEVRAS